MKLRQLKPTKKGRRLPSKGGISFHIVQSGTGRDTVSYGAGITGVSESTGDGFPEAVILKNGYYMQRVDNSDENSDTSAWIVRYVINRLMDENEDENTAVTGITSDTNGKQSAFGNSWIFREAKDNHIDKDRPVPEIHTDMKHFTDWVNRNMEARGYYDAE